MDIESMHPFCLPFGLCHDATSSSTTADFVGSNSSPNNGSTSPTTAGDGGTSSLSSPLSPTSKESRLSSQRSKNLSPSDELFRHLNSISSTTILGQSLLNHHDLIIGTSASLDIIADESFYSSLGIIDDEDVDAAIDDDNEENRLRKSSIATDVEFTDGEQRLDEEEEPIDWYCGEYSLFSPDRRKSLSSSAAAAAIRATNLLHQQVFQHLVDPIDLKSSPTLAQLNLNSNDNDPIDGFWDTTTTASSQLLSQRNPSSSLSLSSSAPTNTDLFSNCTSINKNSLTAGTCCSRTLSNQHHKHHHNHHRNDTNSDNIICNHLNHHTQTQHHHTHHHHLSSSYSSSAHLTSCPHQHLNHQQQQPTYQQQSCRYADSPSLLQGSTCLAVAPFSDAKPEFHQHHQPACCNNQHNLVSTNHSNLSSGADNNNGSNLKPSAALNQLNQQQTTTARPLPNGSLVSQVCSGGDQNPKKRPSSPVLVTSSSSPLSSSSSAITPGQQQLHQQQQQSLVAGGAIPSAGGESNKLKENIEYLTALLCNDNKLENNNQQPSSISSSMARSYATLAQTLSTGPKLFERPLQRPELTTFNVHQAVNMVPSNLTNEAAPCMDTNLQVAIAKRPQNPMQQQHQHHQQQNMQQSQWLKVESSISAADSTESQTMLYTMQAGHDCSTGGLNPHCLHHHQSQSTDPKHLPQQQRAPDLRVLSSLLSGDGNVNNCLQSRADHYMTSPSNPGSSPCPQWAPSSMIQSQQATVQAQTAAAPAPIVDPLPVLADLQHQQSSPIPPNGRPITLTPITNHNNPILQQQTQSGGPKSVRASPFIQPASPSASSTASSGANTDIGFAGSSPAIKRPRLAHAQAGSTKSSLGPKSSPSSGGGSSRSGRPNSMSTECSLSSHDEGFSSQVDNDDCNSNRDSDDEDEVDSDDESFYGDYTNNDLIGASISDDAENKWTLNMGRTRRNGQKRYFWQYNVQSKGPKGTRICSTDDSEDPFVLPEASDPVFSNDCQVEGVKHSGKARRGDGNDLTPNPKKLLMIGLELKKLGKIINELAPVTDLPINARTKTRKEKNKLASRACRLKKKAQHEANKIKLYGLQREHQQVVSAIYDVRKLLNQALAQRDNGDARTEEGHSQALRQSSSGPCEQSSRLTADNNNSSQLTTGTGTVAPTATTTTTNDSECSISGSQTTARPATTASVLSIAEQCSMQVAGQTSNFVNSVLEKVVSGCIDGGLET